MYKHILAVLGLVGVAVGSASAAVTIDWDAMETHVESGMAGGMNLGLVVFAFMAALSVGLMVWKKFRGGGR